MGASKRNKWRWLIIMMPVALGIVWVVAAAGARPSVVTSVENADELAFMPHVSAPVATPTPTPSPTPPPPPQLRLAPYAVGFDTDTITDIAHAGDGRLFVAQREGIIRIIGPNGDIYPEPFLDIRSDVMHEANWEQGLLGVAFHPNFPETPYFYVTYTDIGSVRLARLTVDPASPNKVNRTTMKQMIRVGKPPATGGPSPVHNGGDLAFGPDGYLYIPLGDGGPDPYDAKGVPGDPYNNSQRVDNLLGAILRIDVDTEDGFFQPDCGSEGYSIPSDNPYVNQFGCDEIWATGLRNPWRMSFDIQGDLYISDVGEWKREEINFAPAGTGRGANYGWHCYEGSVSYAALFPQFDGQCGPQSNYTFPVHEYDHTQGECSITGGIVYRGTQYPSLVGRYVFGDFCSHRLWTMIRDQNGEWQVDLAGMTALPYSTFGQDAAGELYVGGWDLVSEVATVFRLVVP